ncbi:hypothetical protein C8J56DRAFT_1071196 [Mycena floridula]|nr:hypothetical protein C8J56DRAFT_1071196 [Mycena floridula]
MSPKQRHTDSGTPILTESEPMTRLVRGMPPNRSMNSIPSDVPPTEPKTVNLDALLSTRPNPFSEQDLARELKASQSSSKKMALCAIYILKRLRNEALAVTSEHLLTPAMRGILANGWTEEAMSPFMTIQMNSTFPNPPPVASSSTNPVMLPILRFESNKDRSGTANQFNSSLLKNCPAPRTFALNMHERDVAAWLIYRGRQDEQYIGVPVLFNNGVYSMNLRMICGIQTLYLTAPFRTPDTIYARKLFMFFGSKLLATAGRYVSICNQLRLEFNPDRQYAPIPFSAGQGIAVTEEMTVRHWFNCGVDEARVNDSFPGGRQFIETYVDWSRSTENSSSNAPPSEEISHQDWKNLLKGSKQSVLLSIPLSSGGPDYYVATHPVVPIQDQARQLKKVKSGKQHVAATPLSTQMNQTIDGLSGVSFSSIPSFVDATRHSVETSHSPNTSLGKTRTSTIMGNILRLPSTATGGSFMITSDDDEMNGGGEDVALSLDSVIHLECMDEGDHFEDTDTGFDMDHDLTNESA